MRPMTTPEIAVANWLDKKGIKYNFQTQLIGGFFQSLGDAKVDFELFELGILLRIQGTYFHKGSTVEAKDIIQKERLTGMGYTVVDCWEEDLTPSKLNYTLSEAIQGREIGG